VIRLEPGESVSLRWGLGHRIPASP
jgi:hypothetical protein